MGGINMVKLRLFDQLIAIADFDIGTAGFVVIIESVYIDMPVPSKFIRQTVVAAVDVAEKNKLGCIIKRYRKGVAKYLVEPFSCANYKTSLKLKNNLDHYIIGTNLTMIQCFLPCGNAVIQQL